MSCWDFSESLVEIGLPCVMYVGCLDVNCYARLCRFSASLKTMIRRLGKSFQGFQRPQVISTVDRTVACERFESSASPAATTTLLLTRVGNSDIPYPVALSGRVRTAFHISYML